MELDYPVHIPDRMFFKIGEVAKIIGVKSYVLRYWETEFAFLNPQKSDNLQRMYNKKDVENCLLIKHLLYDKRYSIEGARKRISELRRSGQLGQERKVKVTLDETRLHAIERAKIELRELIEMCAVNQ
jgi:DNA-binding transcriptional MerR regulator